MRSSIIVIVLISIVAVVTVIAIVMSGIISNRTQISSIPPSAPGSLKPGDIISPNFVTSIERLDDTTFRVVVKPIVESPRVCLDEGSPTELLVLDKQGTKIENVINVIKEEAGPKGTDGLIRSYSRTYKVYPHLPKGEYIISARVEVLEQGPDKVRGKRWPYGVATRVTNSYTLVVK